MTMTLDEAITALQVHARQLEAIQTIAAAIKDVDSLKALANEAEHLRATRQADADAALAALATANDQLADVKNSLKDIQARSAALVEAMNDKKRAMSDEAKAEAAAIVAKAKQDALAVANDAKAELERIQSDVAKASAAFDEITLAYAAKSAALTDIEDKIAQARAMFKGFIG